MNEPSYASLPPPAPPCATAARDGLCLIPPLPRPRPVSLSVQWQATRHTYLLAAARTSYIGSPKGKSPLPSPLNASAHQ